MTKESYRVDCADCARQGNCKAETRKKAYESSGLSTYCSLIVEPKKRAKVRIGRNRNGF